MARVTASLVVNFAEETGGGGGGLTLEIDDREDGLNGGDTSFRPGDTVYYLLYVADRVTVDQHVATAGSRAEAGSGVRQVEEVVQFAGSKEGSLRYPATSAVTMEWIGQAHRTDGQSGAVTRQVIDQQSVRLSAPVAGLLKCSYGAAFTAHRLSGVPTEIEQVLVFVAGEAN